jgi:phosphoglycerate dehydrogenase-like enzyme
MPLGVVVTEPEFIRAGDVFASHADLACHVSAPDESSVAGTIRSSGAMHAIVGPRPYREELYTALGRGSVLARFGVGFDGINLTRATAAGILCTNTPQTMDQSVAELSMMFVAAAARRLVTLDDAMKRGEWAPQGGIELAGKTLAIIGSGRIGAATARIAEGYSMRVIGCRRRATANALLAPDGPFDAMTSDFRTAVSDADFVVLLIPGSAENLHYLNCERLSMLPPRAWLVNTARGSVVDERALYEALVSRRLAGAALDVFEREPYEPVDAEHDLRRLDNVMLVPHIGSNTAEANRRMCERAIQNVRQGAGGRFDGLDLLNPEVLAR